MPSGISIPITFQIFRQDAGGETLVRSETLTQDIIKIGKLSSSHLRIDDESVSRMHAVIEISGPDEIYIIDLGSSKGTMVNGQKVNKSKIDSGDVIVLGSTKLVITVGEPVETGVQDGATQVQATAPVIQSATQMGMPVVPPAAVPAPFAVQQAAPAVAAAAPAFAQPAAPPPAAAPRPAAGFGPAAGIAGPGFDPSAVELHDGSRAIEVAAMFEESVLDIHHFTNPSGGQVTGATKGMFFGGLAAIFLAFVVFVVQYVSVSHEKAALEAWEAQGKPRNEFVIHREGPVKDILVSVCLIFGLAALVVGMARKHEEEKPRDFTIGPDADALFKTPAELLPAARFPLVRSTGSDYELVFTQQMHGDVTVEGQSMSLDQLAQSGRARPAGEVAGAMAWGIPNGARAKIDLGANTFLVSSVPPPRKHPNPFVINWSQQSYTIGTAAVVGLFLGMIFSIPPDPKSLSLDAFMNDQRFAKFLIKPPEEKEEQIPEWLKKKSNDEAGGKGKRHKDTEGKMGKKTSKNKAGLYALKGPKDNPDPHLAKMLAEEAASKAGVLGMLKANDGSHLASIFGRDSALGSDAENVLGGLVGTQVGEAYGVGGLGLVGSGRGGGGTGEGTIGLGNLGTIGKGGGGGSGSGYGRGAGGLSGRRARAPDVVPGTAQVRGSLDKEIIRRVIRRHLNEVKFCYEKELMKKPDLIGRIMIQFTISGTGQVVASVVQNSTMNNPEVEQCVAGAVRRWEFPKPQGGGIVIVSYPFVLKSAGAE